MHASRDVHIAASVVYLWVGLVGHRPYQLEIMSLPPQNLSSKSKFKITTYI